MYYFQKRLAEIYSISQTELKLKLKHRFCVSSGWFGGLDFRQNLFSVLVLVQTGFPQGPLSSHSWIRHNLENTFSNKR